MPDTDVLIAGGGPVGLTAAIELRRRGIRCRIVDPILEPPQYAKAVGVQPRTLEVFEGMGVLRAVLDAAVEMLGQIVYVNGTQVMQTDLILPSGIPFGFVAIPQYMTERILAQRLAGFDTTVERGVRLAAFEQQDDGVTAILSGADGDHTVRARYLVGCDGAHSLVRKSLGLAFEGAAFPEQYMLGDVVVDWAVPPGYGVRSMHQTDGVTDDLLVCIPLPGRGRYRMSMLVPDELAPPQSPADDNVAHGFEGSRRPSLGHIQAVLDRLAPEPTRATHLRWSSVFRISHRIVDSYGRGRVFVAGDAAHIHPPTGAQGMNTGIADAHNLAWKLAFAVKGDAAEGLLASYDAERRPVGEEVVGRTVRSAREGIGTDSSDPDFVIRREAQLLIRYADSPIVADPIVADDATDDQLQPGARAPDAVGLTRAAVKFDFRLYSLLGRDRHTIVFYAGESVDTAGLRSINEAARAADGAASAGVDTYLIAAPGAQVDASHLPVIRDAAGNFIAGYGAEGLSTYVIRPDGYLAFTRHAVSTADLVAHLKNTFR